MIVTENKIRKVEASKPLDEMSYFIDQKNIIHITAMLRNMYSNPVRACIREYSANALDAHMQAGITTPIEVTVPSSFNPAFKVRDFGPGLSKEDTKQLLCGFGSSGDHKRTSNSFVGGFGIGAKVGFAVATAFTYTIWHGGMKRIWSNFLDEMDASKASMLSEEPSDEPTGIEVSVPVESGRISEFINELEDVFMWYDVQPKMLGANVIQDKRPSVVAADTLHIVHNDVKTAVPFELVKWAGYRQNAKPMVLMGGIAYPIEVSTTTTGIDMASLPHKKRKSLENLVIKAPIGLLQLAPSRESLQYSARTKSLLNKILDKIMEDGYVVGLFKNKVKKVTDLRDAYAEAAFYSDMLGEETDACLFSLYPEFKKYQSKVNHYSSSGAKFALMPSCSSLVTGGPVVNPEAAYTSVTTNQWWDGGVYVYKWSDSGYSFNDTFFLQGPLNKMYAIAMTRDEFNKFTNAGSFTQSSRAELNKRLLAHVSNGNLADWNGTGSVYQQYSRASNTMLGLLIILTDNKDLSDAAKYPAIADKIIEEIPRDKFFAYDLAAVSDIYGAKPVSSRSRGSSRGGSTRVASHSRKFSKMNTSSPGSNGRNSDMWDSLLAKDVDSALGYAIPMSEFIAFGANGTGFDGMGASACSMSDDMRFLQNQVLRMDSVRKHVLEDKPIIGIRKPDYDKTLADYEFTPLWGKLKSYFKDYMTANSLTNNHLFAMFMLSMRKAERKCDSRGGLLRPEMSALFYNILVAVQDAGDDIHPLWNVADTWLPYFKWAEGMLEQATGTPESVFRNFFIACHNHWISYKHSHGGKVPEDVPFVRDADDQAFWAKVADAFHNGLNSGASSFWVDTKVIAKLDLPWITELISLVVKYPGIVAFIPDSRVEDHRKDFMWRVVLEGDNQPRVSVGIVDHVVSYINGVTPITK